MLKTLTVLFIVLTFLPVNTLFSQSDSLEIGSIDLGFLLDQEIVSASKYSQKLSEAPVSAVIITSKEIEDFGYRSLDAVLTYVRSFYLSNDRNYTFAGVRGFGRPSDYNNRILTLINGHIMNENVYGSSFIANELGLDISAIERIEILRGPGSALYGTNAMFAVINIITKTSADKNGLTASVEAGSFGRIKGILDYGKEFENGINLFLSASLANIKGSDHYYKEFNTVNNGIASGLDEESFYNFFGSASSSDLNFSFFHSFRSKEVPNAPYGTIFNRASNIEDSRTFLELSYNTEISYNSSFMAKIYYDRYKYYGLWPTDIEGAEVPFYDQSIGNMAGTEFRIKFDPADFYSLLAGLEIKHNFDADYYYWSADTVLFNRNFPFDIYSLYFLSDIQVAKNLTLSLGLRAEEYRHSPLSVTPKFAVVFSPFERTTLKLMYSEAYREPTIYERYYEDVYANFIANPSLARERIAASEFIIEQKLWDGVLFELSFFHNRLYDLIDTRVNPIDSSQSFINVNRSRALGIEADIKMILSEGLSGFMNYSYTDSRDDRNIVLTNAPFHLFNIGAAVKVFDILTVSPLLHFESGRSTVYGTEIDPVLFTDLNLRSEFFNERLGVSLRVNNLFNHEYYSPAGFEFIQDKIRQDGRNFNLRISYSIE